MIVCQGRRSKVKVKFLVAFRSKVKVKFCICKDWSRSKVQVKVKAKVQGQMSDV